MTKTRHNRAKKVVLIICLFLSLFFVACAVTVAHFFNKYHLDVNALTSLNNGIKVSSASGTDSTLYNTNRSIIEIETLPNYVLNAFIDVEDKRFYTHNGFDPLRIIKAGFVNIATNSKSQGASTISQQLIKNALLSNEKTYERKIKEIVLAVQMEKKFSKKEILEMYLNTIYFGSNAYGIENASQIYFNKSAKELSISEACCLAGMIKSPSKYSPKQNYSNCIKRRNVVANAMLEQNNITKNEHYSIVNSEIKFCEKSEIDFGYEQEAIYEACQLLNLTERELINRKYQIITNKNDHIQNAVVKINNEVLGEAEKATQTSLDGLSIVVNNCGEIVAYYANSQYNLHNMKRQPASLLKPLVVYLPCIENNILTPATQILDEPINYNGFKPQNANGAFNGYVSARHALAHSLNIPAVKALEFVGLDKAKSSIERFGINIMENDLNLSLALGALTQGVSLLDLTSSYATLANLGNKYDLTFISKILDSNGKVIYENEHFSQQVFKQEDCFLVNDMLKTTASEGTAKRLDSLNLPVASKTGTASNNDGVTDLYNVAYTPQHTTLSWIACNKDIVLPSGLISSVQPTEINKRILNELYDNPINDFVKPNTVEKMAYDNLIAQTRHIITAPSSSKERYVSYDYFKTEFPPQPALAESELNLTAKIDKFGATLAFEAVKYKEYSIVKKTINKQVEIACINEKSGLVEFEDNNVFTHDEITYFLVDETGTSSNYVTIKPKEFLINTLNLEILNGKKRWSV